MRSEVKILLIGPRLNAQKTNIGGATRSFEELIDFVEKSTLDFITMNTRSYLGLRALIFPIFLAIFAYDCKVIFLNVSANGLKFMGPCAHIVARIFGKKIVIRPFGDSIKKVYSSANPILRFFLTQTIFKADLLLVQTTEQLSAFKKNARNLMQLKTGRPAVNLPIKDIIMYRKRFLYLGQVMKSKGIDELLMARNALDKTFVLDIYGPIVDEKYRYLQNEPFYKGIFHWDQYFSSKLLEYDVLLLPTFYEGEGYPGAIVEAYSYQLPVITTRWKSIPDIVIEGETGFLIDPGSPDQLIQAMKRFSQENYPVMSENALDYFHNNFQLDRIMKKVMKEIESLLKQ